MANVMDLKNISNKVSRNGYDVGRRVAFSAKPGQLLPVGLYEVMPGDRFKIDLKSFTRTIPLNSAAYCRINEYYDVYYVRTNDLWDKFDSFALQLEDNVTKALSLTDSQSIGVQHPYFTRNDIIQYLQYIKEYDKRDVFGFRSYLTTAKLLQYLGYGDFIKYNPDTGNYDVIDTVPEDDNLVLNPFPLLTYQYIYQNSFRNQQWEYSSPYTCNLNFITGTNDLQLKIIQLQDEFNTDTIFDIRYSNWNKDYFFGLLPNSQFGDVEGVSLTQIVDDKFFSGPIKVTSVEGSLKQGGSLQIDDTVNDPGSSITSWHVGAELQSGAGSGRLNYFLSENDVRELRELLSGDVKQLTALAIRQAEYLQKYKEILQYAGRDVRSVLNKIYGVDISLEDAHLPQYLGGYNPSIDINEVVNNNLADAGSTADIKGKGISVGGQNIDFTAKFHGYIMIMYHAQPQLDYATSGIAKTCMKTKFTDYPIPMFDKLGMQKTSIYELTTSSNILKKLRKDVSLDAPFDWRFLGYGPIYQDMKTNYDVFLGAFRQNYSFWGAPFTDEYLSEVLGDLQEDRPASLAFAGVLNANMLKTNPRILDSLFSVPASDTVDSDCFLVNMQQNVYVVRNLDYNGLPY